LLDETDLPIAQIAMRAGFGSLRRFNAVFAEVYGRPPTEICKRAVGSSLGRPSPPKEPERPRAIP
jgi:AraC family transcriptional regulator of adaptative response / DNA-3-methyladenine glycosylase II